MKTQEFRRRKRWHGLDVIKSGGGSAPYAWTRFNTTSGASDFVTANEENKYPDKQTQNGFYYEKIAPYIPKVSWATGTDAEIADMVAAADAGRINLKDYWAVGQERTVNLSAMAATGVGETHAAQSATLVLMDSTCTGFTLATATSGGKTKPDFIVGLKNSLLETGYMNLNSTSGANINGWSGCLRRTWCNDVFRPAIPSSLRGIFKQFKWKQGKGLSATSGLLETTDYFGLAPEKAVFGSRTYSQSDEAALYAQWDWYKTSTNRIKKLGDNGSANAWWESSPSDDSWGFGQVNSYGNVYSYNSYAAFGLSPFGCI